MKLWILFALCLSSMLGQLGAVLGQATNSTNTTLLCFQVVSNDSPTATDLAAFIKASIVDACNFFAADTGNPGPISFNSTGYSFVRINIDLEPPSLDECTEAFNDIVTQCVEGSARDFGDWWSP
jgi:hypothetical protein